MRTRASVAAVGALGLFAVCDLCQPTASASPANQASARIARAVEQKIVTLRIEGMTCGGCAIATRKVLARLRGVSHVDVSYEEKRAVVTYDPAKVTVDQMVAAVQTLGYTATLVPV